MKNLQLQNVIWKEGKYYVAQCLSIDVSSFGKNKKEAVKNLNEALELYFEDIPKSKVSKISKISKPELWAHNLKYA